jgi:hypothetical protein
MNSFIQNAHLTQSRATRATPAKSTHICTPGAPTRPRKPLFSESEEATQTQSTSGLLITVLLLDELWPYEPEVLSRGSNTG